MAEDSIARRSFLKGAGAVGAAAASVLAGDSREPAQAQSAAPRAEAESAVVEPYLTLTAAEAAFLSAAYDTFIPSDALSPSGPDCGHVTYMDRQLAGAWGNGAHLYRAGDGLGGAGAHWNGVTWRFLPSEFVLRSHLTERYGRNAIPEDMTIQDWGITYDDLEPHYDHFERLCGTSGKAGNLRGQKIEGGNIARAAWRAIHNDLFADLFPPE
jgi:choline dehydrogenase-like flavoprotein